MKRKKKKTAAPTTREQEKLDKWHLLGTKAMDRWGWFAPSTKKQQYEMVSVAVYWMFQLSKKNTQYASNLLWTMDILRYIRALSIFFFFFFFLFLQIEPLFHTPRIKTSHGMTNHVFSSLKTFFWLNGQTSQKKN